MWGTIIDTEDIIIKKIGKTTLPPGIYTLVGQHIKDKWIQHVVSEITIGAEEENKARKGKIHVGGDENDRNFRKDTQGKSHRNNDF